LWLGKQFAESQLYLKWAEKNWWLTKCVFLTSHLGQNNIDKTIGKEQKSAEQVV